MPYVIGQGSSQPPNVDEINWGERLMEMVNDQRKFQQQKSKQVIEIGSGQQEVSDGKFAKSLIATFR